MEETAQELTDHVSQFQKYLDEHTPELISFGIKVVLSIVVLYIGSRLIRWVLGLVRRSLGRTGMDKGAVQFLCSFLKALLYILLIFGIGMNFGIKESSVAALLGTAGVTIGLALQGGLSNLAGSCTVRRAARPSPARAPSPTSRMTGMLTPSHGHRRPRLSSAMTRACSVRMTTSPARKWSRCSIASPPPRTWTRRRPAI